MPGKHYLSITVMYKRTNSKINYFNIHTPSQLLDSAEQRFFWLDEEWKIWKYYLIYWTAKVPRHSQLREKLLPSKRESVLLGRKSDAWAGQGREANTYRTWTRDKSLSGRLLYQLSYGPSWESECCLSHLTKPSMRRLQGFHMASPPSPFKRTDCEMRCTWAASVLLYSQVGIFIESMEGAGPA